MNEDAKSRDDASAGEDGDDKKGLLNDMGESSDQWRQLIATVNRMTTEISAMRSEMTLLRNDFEGRFTVFEQTFANAIRDQLAEDILEYTDPLHAELADHGKKLVHVENCVKAVQPLIDL